MSSAIALGIMIGCFILGLFVECGLTNIAKAIEKLRGTDES